MIADAMSQAIEEATTGKEEDNNGVYFFYEWHVRTDDSARIIPGSGAWRPHILIMSVSHRNQEIRRPVREADQLKYPTKWAKFIANAPAELASRMRALEEQVASLRALIGNPVTAPAKRRGRPPKPQVNGVAPHTG